MTNIMMIIVVSSTIAISVCTYIHTHTTYIYRYMLTPPPMIHPNLLLASSGSWEVGNLRCEVPPNSPNLSNYGPARLIDARIFGILWKLEPGEVFALQALQTLGKFEPGDVLANFGCENTARLEFRKIPEA